MLQCKNLLTAAAFWGLSFFSIYSQNSALQMPEISGNLDMPSVTPPAIGTKFYAPGNYIRGKKIETKEIAAPKGSRISKQSAPLKNAKTSDSTRFFKSGKTNVSAQDIASLAEGGFLDNIFSFADNGKVLQNSLFSGNNYDSMLENILLGLEDLKKNISIPENTNDLNYKSAVSYTEKTEKRPAVLRFTINGSNILSSCKTIYFSSKEIDGSFLMTGDRKYLSENKPREETFYFLFKSDGNAGSSAGYYVQPAVIQDFKNEYSFVYKLSLHKDLKAKKTGNLISLKASYGDLNADLLLDIGNKE